MLLVDGSVSARACADLSASRLPNKFGEPIAMAGAQGGVGPGGWTSLIGDPSSKQIADALNSAHALIGILKNEIDQLKSKGQQEVNKKDLK